MEQEVEEAFRYARVPASGRAGDVIRVIEELRVLSTEWNAPYYDHILYSLVNRYQDASSVIDRLAAERDFFSSLYRPAEGFSIHPVDGYAFDYDGAVMPTIIFQSGSRVYGCADFSSHTEALVLDYIQGASGSTSQEQIDAFGGRWFEVFMDRAVEAYALLSAQGVGLMLRLDDARYLLPRMVRDRYFSRRPTKGGPFLPIAMGKQRVKRIFDPV